MKIVENLKMIRRNALIGQVATFGGLFVLIGGMVISFTRPELFMYSFLALMLGFILSQVGLFFGARWGRKPRVDQIINAGLKGLDGRHTIYHYTTPVSHLLVGPSGVWVIVPRMQRGEMTYSKGRWRQVTSSNPLNALGQFYMRTFAQEGIDRPDVEIEAEVARAQKVIAEIFGADTPPEINAVLVFTHPQASLSLVDNDPPPVATTLLKELKNIVRKTAKTQGLSQPLYTRIQTALEAE